MATAMQSFNESEATVNFTEPRSFGTVLKSDIKETLFPDDPFYGLKNEPPKRRIWKTFQYFIPMLEWLPQYNLKLFRCDFVAGITIASLTIPQGISYAKLAEIPPIIGLCKIFYSFYTYGFDFICFDYLDQITQHFVLLVVVFSDCSFIPPFVYALFGSSKCLAIGNMAATSLMIAAAIKEKNVFPETDPKLYLNLVITAGFLTGVMQLFLGVCRLGLLVNFLSHATSIGFIAGTATIICLQQLKGFLGLKHFTKKTDVFHVIQAVFKNRNEVCVSLFPFEPDDSNCFWLNTKY